MTPYHSTPDPGGTVALVAALLVLLVAALRGLL